MNRSRILTKLVFAFILGSTIRLKAAAADDIPALNPMLTISVNGSTNDDTHCLYDLCSSRNIERLQQNILLTREYAITISNRLKSLEEQTNNVNTATRELIETTRTDLISKMNANLRNQIKESLRDELKAEIKEELLRELKN